MRRPKTNCQKRKSLSKQFSNKDERILVQRSSKTHNKDEKSDTTLRERENQQERRERKKEQETQEKQKNRKREKKRKGTKRGFKIF